MAVGHIDNFYKQLEGLFFWLLHLQSSKSPLIPSIKLQASLYRGLMAFVLCTDKVAQSLHIT